MTRTAARLPRGPLFNLAVVTASALIWFFVGATLLSQFPVVLRVFPGSLEKTTDDIAALVQLIEAAPPEARPLAAQNFSNGMRSARLSDDFPPQADRDESMVRLLRGARSGSILSAREMQFRKLRLRELVSSRDDSGRLRIQALAANEISIRLENGDVLVIWISPIGMAGYVSIPILGLVIILLLVFSGASTLGFRYALGRLQVLETSATAYQPGSGSRPVDETGPTEVRRLAKALNAMQTRVDQLTRERSFLVAGVAHDIRTNITRMRLRLDQLRSPRKAALEADLSQTEQLVDDLMVYARADRPDGVTELIDLAELAQKVARDQAFELPVSGCETGFVVAADRAALERALSNLISNAWKYGQAARVQCSQRDGGFEIFVDDDGPGIPEEHLSRVMDPFYRVEPSRNPETGGTGLGLTIARDLITAQGGALSIENRSEGGLRARISFPADCRID